MRVLDPCCGGRMMYHDKRNPSVVFGDIRNEKHIVKDTSHGKKNGVRHIEITPDLIMDFRDLPFPDEIFNLVVFDPPHLKRAGEKSWIALKYGVLGNDWREDIKQGFSECFRVLRTDGTLIFKWNEDQIKIKEVLDLTSQKPLFGHLSGRKGLTHWLVFIKDG